MQKAKFVKGEKYKTSDSGKVYFFAIIAILALNLIFSLIADAIASQSTLDKVEAVKQVYASTGFNCAFGVCSFLVLLGVFFAHLKIENYSIKACKINKKLDFKVVLICIWVGIIALLGLQYLTGVFDDFLTLIKFPLDNSSAFKLDSFGGYILAILILAVIPAIGEEFIFRGVVFQGLRNKFSSVSAILLSSIMFALFHMNLQQIFYQFLLGAIMAWLVYRTGSLISSMIVHFTSNFLVVTMEYIRVQTGFSFNIAHSWWFYILAVVLAVVTFVIFYLIDRFYFQKVNKTEKLSDQQLQGSKEYAQSFENLTEDKETKTSGYVWLSLSIAVLLLVVGTISSYLA